HPPPTLLLPYATLFRSTPATADVAVALLTYNNVETVKMVAATAAAGLAQHFPGLSAVLIDADAGSSDGTPETLETAGLPLVVTRSEEHTSELQSPCNLV